MPTGGENEMRLFNNGMVTIPADGANIIARFDDAELVAVLADNGNVALFAEDDDMLMQMCSWTKSTKLLPVDLARNLLGG